MKNFTKLLMSVVLLATFACVQDPTEVQAPVISEVGSGSGEVQTLQASMPVSTRTELGEKVDGKYPVSWSEGDALAINGKKTTGITIDPHQKGDRSVAVFNLPMGITIPYHIVYPYQGDNVAVEANSGKYPVVFSAEQVYTEGSFAQGSAPMYGWSDGFKDIQMVHLATALRFSIKAMAGEKVDLKYVSVSTPDATPIAGVFDVYCADKGDVKAGTLEPRKNTSPTVFYGFGETEDGEDKVFSLTNKESVFYIVVPKGEYNSFEVNFVEKSGLVYSRTFGANGDKQLRGGKVREFETIEFDYDNCSKMLLIGNDADMQTFANEIKAGTFNSKYAGALLVADVDMTGKEWTSLNGFTSTLEGRGFTIRGLKTPLFGENVVATISNLNVEGDLVETTDGKVGLIARSLVADGEKVGTIFNCSAKGSIEYKNETLPVSNDPKLINIGGVVGGVYGGMVTLSDSDVNITVTTSAGADGKTTAYTPCVGGVVGYACKNGESLPVVMENTSSGAIVWDDDSESTTLLPFIGGVAGYVTAGSFADNINSGALQITAEMYDLDWGGVIGASEVDIVHCENKGSLTINEKITKANIGGVIGKLEAGSITDSENSGALLFDEKFYINDNVNIGGVIAYADKGTKEIKNCSNSGSITYLGECMFSSNTATKGSANIVIGGVIGISWSEAISECHNQASGVLNIAGKVAGNGNKSAGTELVKRSAIAGVIGVRTGNKFSLGIDKNVTMESCSNRGNVKFTWQYCSAAYIFNSACIGIFDSDYVEGCKNEGIVSVEASTSSDSYTNPTANSFLFYVSGLFGCIYSNCDHIYDCENTGTIEVRNSCTRMLYVSGLLGTAMTGVAIKLTRCGNSGNIIVYDDVNVRNVYIGGIMASTINTKIQYPNCFNSGNVESKAVATAETYLGSIFGFSTLSNTGAGTEGIVNNGRVTYSGKSALAYVGGYCGQYKEYLHTVQFTNTKSGVVEFRGDASCGAYVGGVAGIGASIVTNNLSNSNPVGTVTSIEEYTPILGGEFEKGMVNNGNVKIYGYAPKVYVSGCFGYLATTSSMNIGSASAPNIVTGNQGVKGLTNNGVVEYPANDNPKGFPESIYIGGVFGYANAGNAYPATVGQISETQAIADCTNTGDVIYSGIARDGAYVGGIVGAAIQTPIFNCVNDGKVFSDGHAGEWSPRETEAGEKATLRQYTPYMNHDLAVGGIVGEVDLDISGCSNTGEVTHECLLNPLRIDYLGQTATSRFDVGGIAGRVFVKESNKNYYELSMDGLMNSGAVTIKGTPSATLCSPSADLEDNGEYQWTDVDDGDRMNKRPYTRVNVAGLVGRMMDLSQKSGAAGENVENKFFMSGCINDGDVTVPEAGGAKCLSVAGAVADLLISHMDFTNITNNGKIAVENVGVGNIIAGKQMMHAYFINLGGIVATYFDHRIFANTAVDWTNNFPHHHVTFNNCTNNASLRFYETGASVYHCAGGIVGQILHTAADRSVNINHNGYVAGKWYKSFTDVTFENCTNTNKGKIEYVSSCMSSLSSHHNYTYGGGILGSGGYGHASVAQWYNAINLVFDHCTNAGDIQFDRSNGNASDNSDPFMTCVGGIVGHYTGGMGRTCNADNQSGTTVSRADACNAQIISCKNEGYIHGFSGILGGIIGNGNWYVKITGTPDEPTINKGDIVVIRDKGTIITSNRYGNKYMYAGGIAGYMREFHSVDYAVKSAKEGDNNAHPDYMPEHMYCRIEYAVNEGAVGSTGMAGGIAGYYYSAVEAANREGKLMDHRGGLEFCRNTGDIYALEESTINVGAIVGMPRMFTYTGTDVNEITNYLLSRSWQNGVRNCEVGGSVLRGAVDHFKVDENNYQGLIYGEPWTNKFYSVIEDKPYDGCTFYVAPTETPEETPEDGEEGAEPAKR